MTILPKMEDKKEVNDIKSTENTLVAKTEVPKDLSQHTSSDSQTAGDKGAIDIATEKDGSEGPFAHFPRHEREVLEKQLHVVEQKVSFFGLYRSVVDISTVLCRNCSC